MKRVYTSFNLKYFLYYWLPVLVWLGVIFWFSSQPSVHTSEIYWQDFTVKKSAHMTEYGILGILFYRALNKRQMDKKQALIATVLFALFYGVTDEFHQRFTFGREPAIRDVVFDTIGAGLVIYLIWKYLPKAPKKLKLLAKKLQLL